MFFFNFGLLRQNNKNRRVPIKWSRLYFESDQYKSSIFILMKNEKMKLTYLYWTLIDSYPIESSVLGNLNLLYIFFGKNGVCYI